MNKRDAKAFGRWCEKHKKVHRRVMIEGGWATGCPDCLNAPKMREALAALASAAMKHIAETT